MSTGEWIFWGALLVALWLAGLVVLFSITVNAPSATGSVIASVLFLALVLGGPGVAIYQISKAVSKAVSADSERWYEQCRAAGGVPVESYRAVNCWTADGRPLDIE